MTPTVQEFAKQMEAFQRASGVPARKVLDAQRRRAGLPELGSIEEWRRRAEQSQRRSDERRGTSPHPLPKGREWLWVIPIVVLTIALGFAFVWLAAAVV